MRLSPAVWKYIEHELFNYEHTKEELHALRGQIIDGAPVHGEGGSSGPGDPTGSKAIKLVSSPAIAQMQRTVSAIDTAFRSLGESHEQLYELRYGQGKPWQAVCMEMPTSRRQFFRMRRELVITVGANLGLINYAEIIEV